jgi:hypothetical protein
MKWFESKILRSSLPQMILKGLLKEGGKKDRNNI